MTRTAAFASLLSLLAALLFAPPGASWPAPPVRDAGDDTKAEQVQPQSPPLPAPAGLKFSDQGANDKRLAGYRTPEGFKVEIVAEDPVVVNPHSMTFADDGTPYVIERLSAARSTGRKEKGAVKALTSSKKNGIFDKAKIILEDESPAGILLHDGWIYLSGKGTVRRYRQSKPGGAYDKKEVIAKGFGGRGQRQVSGMTLGNDGWLYLTCGAGNHSVEGSDGSRGTVLRTGAIFRCKPDGSKMETYAIGFCNPSGNPAFDLGGNLFHIDGDQGEKGRFAGCRLMHVPEAADFGWRIDRSGRPDLVRCAAFGELPGKLPPLLKTGSGSPAGLLIYNDTRLPEEYRGLLFYPDANRRLIRAYKVEQTGASFKAGEEFEFLTAPKDALFRPCGMVVGPDGALYILLDRRTRSHEGDKLGATGNHGRIYRVSWTGTKDQPALPLRAMDSWSKIAGLEDKELIETLSSEEDSDRSRARQELVKRGDKNRKALIQLLGKEVPLVTKIAALGALESMFDDDVRKAFQSSLKTGDAELQRLAAKALGQCAKKADRNASNALLQELTSDDFALRRAVALAMSRLASPGAADSLATSLSFDKSKDVFLRDGILRGLEMLGKPGIDALISLADSGVQKDTDRVVEAFQGLRSREAFAALPTLLKHMHVSSAQRVELIRSALNYLLEPGVALEPIVAVVAAEKKETSAVKKALLDVLATPGTVKGAKAKKWLLSMLTDDNAEIRLSALAAAAEMRLSKAGPILAKRLGAEKVSAAETRAVLKALAATAEGARLAGKLYLEKKLPESLRGEVVAALQRHADKDPDAAKLLAKVKKGKEDSQ
jgi:putative membrane-bound dehydrogenase-like protein